MARLAQPGLGSTSAGASEARVVGEYVIQRPIGAGAYGTVYKAQNRRTGQLVAIKSINHAKLVNQKLKENLEVEISILMNSRHRNIVRLYDVVRTENETHLVMEFCDGGELSTYLRERKRLSENVARHFLRQMAAALEFMRAHNMIHRDLKPSNILLMSSNDDTATLKIADFGYARYVDPYGVAETACGTPLYMAPEVFAAEPYSAKADLWSVGCILYEMVCGKVPFLATTQVLLFRLISDTRVLTFPPDVQLSHECQDLLRKLLTKDPLARISVESFFLHPFLDFSHYERENPYADLLSSRALVMSGSNTSAEADGLALLNEAASTPMSMPMPMPMPRPVGDHGLRPGDADAPPANSPSNNLLNTELIQPQRGRGREDDEYVMVERDNVRNIVTLEVLMNAPVAPGSYPGAIAIVDGRTASPPGPSARAGTPGLLQQHSPPGLAQSPTQTTLSRVMSWTGGLLTATTNTAATAGANVVHLLPPADPSDLTQNSEDDLRTEIDKLGRGAITLMEYAEELERDRQTQPSLAQPSDVYMIYLKTLVVFTETFRKARRFWEVRGHNITKQMQAIVRTLNDKYQECLRKAETLQALIRPSNNATTTSSVTVSMSEMRRSTNRFYELLVGGAQRKALLGLAAEQSNDLAYIKLYNSAILLFEMVLLPDEQRPLSSEQREQVHQLLRGVRERLELAQRQSLQPRSPPNAGSA